MSAQTFVVIGNESLAVQCGERALARGHALAAVVTRNGDVAKWAAEKGIAVIRAGAWAGRAVGGDRA